MNIPKPRAVIFDWDNTLVDTWPIIHEALNRTFAEHKLPEWTIERVRRDVKKSMRDSFPEIFGEKWQDAGAAYQRHYRSIHLERLTPLPEVETMLKLLQRHALPVAVVSNKKGNNLREEVTHLQWQPYFKSVVGSDDAKRDKPHPEPVEMALGALNIPPGNDIWFVGDSEIDLHCAANTGCTPILFGRHVREHPELSPTHYFGHGYRKHVDDHAGLMALFNRY